jgi:hypothetical protein
MLRVDDFLSSLPGIRRMLIVSANFLVVLVYVLMAVVRQKELFLVVAALAGVGWTLSASELWVAAQRAMPGWARRRLNATVIMVSQAVAAEFSGYAGQFCCFFGKNNFKQFVLIHLF